MAWDLVMNAEAGHGTAVAFISGIDAAAVADVMNEQLVLTFSADGDDAALFKGVMPEGLATGSNIDIDIYWSSDTATAEDCVWHVYFMRCIAGTTVLSGTGEFNTTGQEIADAAGAAKRMEIASVSISNANADGVQPGEMFYMLVIRDGDATTPTADDMSGAALLYSVKLSQT